MKILINYVILGFSNLEHMRFGNLEYNDLAQGTGCAPCGIYIDFSQKISVEHLIH